MRVQSPLSNRVSFSRDDRVLQFSFPLNRPLWSDVLIRMSPENPRYPLEMSAESVLEKCIQFYKDFAHLLDSRTLIYLKDDINVVQKFAKDPKSPRYRAGKSLGSHFDWCSRSFPLATDWPDTCECSPFNNGLHRLKRLIFRLNLATNPLQVIQEMKEEGAEFKFSNYNWPILYPNILYCTFH